MRIGTVGVHLPVAGGPPVFRPLPAPTGAQLQTLVQQIAARVGRLLEQRGMVERDMTRQRAALAARQREAAKPTSRSPTDGTARDGGLAAGNH